MEKRRLLALVLWCAVGATALAANPGDPLPVSRVLGRGASPKCLGSVEVTGVKVPAEARVVTCEDGDPSCDRDGEPNGRCQFWIRACFGSPTSCGRVTGAHVRRPTDPDLVILDRALGVVKFPVTHDDTCAPMTTLTVPLRGAGKKQRRGRVRLGLDTLGAGVVDHDGVTFECRPAPAPRRAHLTFRDIQRQVFATTCAAASCHGDTGPQEGLTLIGPGAWDALVDKPALETAGVKRLVVPGSPDASFLLDKLRGQLSPTEGGAMPLDRSPLPTPTIDAISQWIAAGAPRTKPFDASLGASASQPRIDPLSPPAGGYQVHMTPAMLGTERERTGCEYLRLGNPEDIFVSKWEFAFYEGMHHVDLFTAVCGDFDGNGINDCDQPDFDSRFPATFGPCDKFINTQFVALLASTLSPHTILDFQTPLSGVAVRLHKNQPIILSTHFLNTYSNTMANGWVNISTADPSEVKHESTGSIESYAYGLIKDAPGTLQQPGWYACSFADCPYADKLPGYPHPTADSFMLLGLTSHMHWRSHKVIGDLFDVDGTRILRGPGLDMIDPTDGSAHFYVSADPAHPTMLRFDQGLRLKKGQHLQYTCFYDNGVERPVKLGCEEQAGVPPGISAIESYNRGLGFTGGFVRPCSADSDCAGYGTGRCVPANLVYGELADDAMCGLGVAYYPCGNPGDCPSP